MNSHPNLRPSAPAHTNGASSRASCPLPGELRHAPSLDLQEQVRARNRLALLTVVLSIASIVFTLAADKVLHADATITLDVFGVGMFGGLFSTLQRIQKFRAGAISQTDDLGALGGAMTVALSPFLGGLGAVLLFVLLSAGFVKGAILPNIPQVSLPKDALEGMFSVQIESSTEAAKLYLFCFLAGFSERLVPDSLSRLSALAQNEK